MKLAVTSNIMLTAPGGRFPAAVLLGALCVGPACGGSASESPGSGGNDVGGTHAGASSPKEGALASS